MLDAVLAYLKDPANRAVLAWLGAGVVTIATALWVIIKFFASKPSVRADNGGVAIGGSNSGNISTAPPKTPQPPRK